MNRLSQIRPVWWTAFMAGVFLVSLSFAFRFVREEMDRVNRLSVTRRELLELHAQSKKKLTSLSQQLVDPVVDLKNLFGTGSLKEPFTFSELKTENLPGGFRHHQVTVTVQNLAPEKLPILMRNSENAVPPWRITSIRMNAIDGRLDGELLLEALDKSPPEL